MQGVKVKRAADVINARCDKTGMPLSFLSRETGLKQNAVYRGLRKRGGNYIRAEEFVLYCVALGLSLDDFIEKGGGEDADATHSADRP